MSGCVTAPAAIQERETYWRTILTEEAPAGTTRNAVRSVYQRHGLQPGEGTYHTVHADGSESSNCRLPDKALSAKDRSAVRGLYLNWDIEITVCFDEGDVVEGHYVGAWNAGI